MHMDTISNQRFISVSMQKILNLLYYKKELYFKNQFIYKDRQAFNGCMEFLCRNDFAKSQERLIDGHFVTTFSLSLNGTVVYEEVFKVLK